MITRPETSRRSAPGATATRAPVKGRTLLDSYRAHPSNGRAKHIQDSSAMPKGKSPGRSVKKPKVYEALRDKRMSKERAAKISNAMASRGTRKGKRKT